jgi:hypothetical protein
MDIADLPVNLDIAGPHTTSPAETQVDDAYHQVETMKEGIDEGKLPSDWTYDPTPEIRMTCHGGAR